MDCGLVVDHNAGAGRETKPGRSAIRAGLAAELGRDSIVQGFGFDRLKKALKFTLPQARRIDQQNHIGGGCGTLGLEPSENTCIIRIHPIDADAGTFGEVRIQRFIRRVMAGRINIEGLLGRRRCRGHQDQGAGQLNFLKKHVCSKVSN